MRLEVWPHKLEIGGNKGMSYDIQSHGKIKKNGLTTLIFREYCIIDAEKVVEIYQLEGE